MKKKSLPKFKNEKEEREFWATHDSADYVDWTQAKRTTFSKLKPSTEAISLRLPKSLLDDLRVLANKHDIPYQSLMKMMLAEKVAQSFSTSKDQ